MPYQEITALRLTGTGGNGIRGSYWVYLICYLEEGREKDTEVTVFTKTMGRFDQFQKMLQAQNPAIQIKNWSTSFDGLIRLFRKK